MSKIIDQPILMVAERGVPKKFFWIKRWVIVEKVIDMWNEVGRWWEGETEKVFYRIMAREGIMYEVYSDKRQWNLYRVYD